VLGAGVGEFDQVPPPVLGRAPAFDELLGFKLVEQPDDVRPVYLQGGG
jgi:hypothetical protein